MLGAAGPGQSTSWIVLCVFRVYPCFPSISLFSVFQAGRAKAIYFMNVFLRSSRNFPVFSAARAGAVHFMNGFLTFAQVFSRLFGQRGPGNLFPEWSYAPFCVFLILSGRTDGGNLLHDGF